MKKWPIIFFLICAFHRVDAERPQHWNDLVIKAGIGPRTELEIQNRSRWREVPFTATFQNCLQAGLKYQLSRNLNVFFAYRYDIQDRSDYYEFENRLLVQFSGNLPSIMGVSPRLSQRTEFRYFTRATDDHLRLRLRLDLSRKVGAGKLSITPALGYELFWDDSDDEINRSRLYIGLGYSVTSRYKIKLTWIHQKDRGKKGTDILNSGLDIAF